MMMTALNETQVSENIATFTPASFVITRETTADIAEREALLDRVMGEGRKRKSSEKLRRKRLPADGLALIARDENGIMVGTVRLWHISAGKKPDGKNVPALLLGPLAVETSLAGRGVGSALMRQAIESAKQFGHKAILLVGNPEYYTRFGFIGGKTDALAMPGPVERHRFLALELENNYLSGAAGLLTATGKFNTLVPSNAALAV